MSRTKVKNITRIQFLIFKFISDFKDRNNRHPSLSHTAQHFGLSDSAIAVHLNYLQDKKYIKKIFHEGSHKVKRIDILKDYSSESTLKDLTGLSKEEILDLFSEDEVKHHFNL